MSYQYPFKDASEFNKRQVWNKAKTVPGKSSMAWREDTCGALIKFVDHGNRKSKYGWEIDHIRPKARGGLETISNLQPLHWENNAKKGDQLNWRCP